VLKSMTKAAGALLLLGCFAPLAGSAAELNLATLSCDKYEHEIIGSPDETAVAEPSRHPDMINMVMWLFGYSVAKSGDHMMYGDALLSFGFALDAECKNNPSVSLLEAVTTVRPKRDKPMNLMTLNCADFESRHEETAHSDAESAETIMMWLYGYSVGQSGGHLFDPGGLTRFAQALQKRCAEHTDESLFDALVAVKGK